MNNRRRIEGVVTSNTMQKTVVVEISRTFRHQLYEKVISTEKRVMAHDEIGCEVGDRVLIVESQPISKNKHWVVQEVLREGIAAEEPEYLDEVAEVLRPEPERPDFQEVEEIEEPEAEEPEIEAVEAVEEEPEAVEIEEPEAVEEELPEAEEETEVEEAEVEEAEAAAENEEPEAEEAAEEEDEETDDAGAEEAEAEEDSEPEAKE